MLEACRSRCPPLEPGLRSPQRLEAVSGLLEVEVTAVFDDVLQSAVGPFESDGGGRGRGALSIPTVISS